ncbi:MAG: hypothetical protein ACFE7R_05730 [Candidatus Hodarchaeota archaeon]
MNLRVLFKSMRFAFRARKRVLAFIIIYAILFIAVSRGLAAAVSTPGSEAPYLTMAFIVATVYAILISQFRRRDIAILKCISWDNYDILLLLIGEVVLVSLSAFFVVFQLSVEILGLIAYFEAIDTGLLEQIRTLIAVDAGPMFVTLFIIVGLQIPGLILAQLRAMRIPPMRALREE